MSNITGLYSCSSTFLRNHNTDSVKFHVESDAGKQDRLRISFVLKDTTSALIMSQSKIPSDTAYFEYSDASEVKSLSANQVLTIQDMNRFLTAVNAEKQ